MDDRKNLILDLDESIICGLDNKQEKEFNLGNEFQKYNMDNEYMIYERPDLQEFLDEIFSKFNVSIWTAASREYCMFIVDKIILNPKNYKVRGNRKLEYVFFSNHCSISKKLSKNKNNFKNLSILTNNFKLDGFDLQNTYIIDDNIDVKQFNGTKCFSIKPFDVRSEKSFDDNQLEDLLVKLKKL